MGSEQPLVSVIMPAYNAERYLVQAMDSLLAQTYQHWELLVADDGSRDSTRALIDSVDDPRIRRYHQDTNQGYLKTWNSLLPKAAGTYITFLDADDYIHPDRLQRLVEFLEKHPEIAICGSGIAYVDDNQEIESERQYPTEWAKIQKDLYHPTRFPFCGSAVMIRREVAGNVEGYRPFFDRLGWEDHDWLIRCCEQYRATNLPEILYYYRQNPASVSRSVEVNEHAIRKLIIKKIGLELALQRKNMGRDWLTGENPAALKALVAKHEAPYRNDPSRLYRVLSARARRDGDLTASRQLAWQGLRHNFFHPSNYLAVIRSIVAAFRS